VQAFLRGCFVHIILVSIFEHSTYAGVTCVKEGKKRIWNAEIEYNHKAMFLGSFGSELEATNAIDAMNKKLGLDGSPAANSPWARIRAKFQGKVSKSG